MTDSANWEEERFTLQRLLVRTSLVAEGQDPDLDRLLDELRDALRGACDLPLLKTYQLKLDQALTRLDQTKSTADDGQWEAVTQLLSALQRDYTGSEASRALKGLKKDIARAKGDTAELADWLTRLTAVIAQATPRETGDRPRGWRRFFAGESKPSDRDAELQGQTTESANGSFASGEDSPAPRLRESTEAPQVNPGFTDLDIAKDPGISFLPEGDSIAEQNPLGPAPAARPRARDSVGDESTQEESGQRFRIAIRVGELLEHVLGQVSLDSEAHNRALQLREQLRASDAWDDLRFALNEIVDLVIAAISRGRSEFEDFLKQLDERLQSMKDTFELQEQADAGRRVAADELDKSVVTQLGTIGELVEGSSDIGSLKSSVSQHLQAIALSFSSYRKQEHEREQVLEQKLATMQERLAGMEAYSEKMQEQLSVERDRAMTDALTQLPNRGAWQERFQLEFDRWQRYKNPITLVIIDIDHFKTVNDTYGHKVGDRVIQLVAKALQDRLRKTDFVARYGGEEFVALLPETDGARAVEAVDNLREHVAALPFRFQETPVRITISAGVATFGGADGPDVLFGKADQALYRAKDSGRNQVVSAD